MPTIGSIVPILRKSGSSDIVSPNLGWVGSKAASKGDLVTIDANGRADQLVAVTTAYTSATGGRLGAIDRALTSSAAQGSAVNVEKLDDDTLIALQATNGTESNQAQATTNAMIGKQFPLYRTTSGVYTVNVTTNTNPVVECVAIDPRYNVGEVGGTLLLRVLPAFRLA